MSQVKSTWEARFKVSEEHEKERRRLEDEQAAARRQLDAAKEANWRLLEEKADLAVSLGHVTEIVKTATDSTAGPAGPAAAVAPRLAAWGSGLREIARLEAALSEQDTVVHVYRADLLKTAHAVAQAGSSGSGGSGASSSSAAAATPLRGQLLTSPSRVDEAGPGGYAGVDPATLSQWQQLAAKFGAIRMEAGKWTALQDALLAALTAFADEARGEEEAAASGAVAAADTIGGGSGGSGSGGAAEVVRGLRLLARQVRPSPLQSSQYLNLITLDVPIMHIICPGGGPSSGLRRVPRALPRGSGEF